MSNVIKKGPEVLKRIEKELASADCAPVPGSRFESVAMEECRAQWECLPATMRTVMDRATWDLAWQMGWCGGMKEMNRMMENDKLTDRPANNQ